MARRSSSSVAVAAALTVGMVLVGFELLVRSTSLGVTGARLPSALVSDALRTATSLHVSGWPALAVPVVLVLLLGLVIDALSGTRR